jgi:hypothetical protein
MIPALVFFACLAVILYIGIFAFRKGKATGEDCLVASRSLGPYVFMLSLFGTNSHTPLPVIGVPVESPSLKGLDSLLSIVQMPAGVPVATVAIGGGRNAGLLALQILAASDASLRARVLKFKAQRAAESRAKNQRLAAEAAKIAQP